ncbi:MAG TPA: hypothetical protein VK168_03970 [Saprospiraceae bacterium]|nr:hypothetical protein [Saprospiraceae bacterium]
MNINEMLEEYLQQRKAQAFSDFRRLTNPNPLMENLLLALESIDEELVQQNFFTELVENCQNNWTNEEEGFNPEEKIQVLLFEYDYYFTKNPLALAYGLIGKDFKIKIKPYRYGYNYEFASSLEANNGLTLTTFSPLAALGDEIPEAYASYDFFEDEGFTPLIDAYKFTTYLIAHRAVRAFVKTNAFKRLSRETILHVMIGEHDTWETQPIYFDCADPNWITKAIELQGEGV